MHSYWQPRQTIAIQPAVSSAANGDSHSGDHLSSLQHSSHRSWLHQNSYRFKGANCGWLLNWIGGIDKAPVHFFSLLGWLQCSNDIKTQLMSMLVFKVTTVSLSFSQSPILCLFSSQSFILFSGFLTIKLTCMHLDTNAAVFPLFVIYMNWL